MGNWCIDVCNNINNTIRGGGGEKSQQAGKGGKKGKLIDFKIGISTVSKEEFKQAARKKKEEQEKLEKIGRMDGKEIEKKLNEELEQIKRTEFQKKFRKKDFKYFDEETQQRIYNFSQLDKDELLQNILGFSTVRMLNEKQCEPLAYFPLKNSDELLWEDRSEYLQNIVLDDIIEIDETDMYKMLVWQGKRLQNLKQQYLITITQIKKNEHLLHFEENFYFHKSIQQLLSLIKQDTIASDLHNISYMQQWFLLHYSNIFVTVSDKPIATLREIIKIRAAMPKQEGAYKQSEILGFLILMMRALRDAKSIYVHHGSLNDENIYLSGNGQYKIKGFNELRIARYQIRNRNLFLKKKSTIYEQSDQDNSYFEDSENMNDEGQEEQYGLSCTYSYLKYYIKYLKPRHFLFMNDVLRPVVYEGLQNYQKNQLDKVEHQLGKERLVRDTEEVFVSSLLMQQNFYSLAIIAIQMISLGKFEQWCQEKSKISYHSNQDKDSQEAKAASRYIGSFCGLYTDDTYLNQRIRNPEEFQIFQIKTYIEIMQFLAQYQLQKGSIQNYSIVILYLQDMLRPNCDWKRIMDQLQEEEFDPPNDFKLFNSQTIGKTKADQPKTELEKIIEYEENKNGMLTRAFNASQEFITLRNYFYQTQGYMLIRNTKLGQESAKQILKDIEQLEIFDQAKLSHYKIQEASDIFFNKTEIMFVKFCMGFCQMQNRELDLAFDTFVQLEKDVQTASAKTLKKLNNINVKFYQGLITFIKGEAEDALLLFNRVVTMTKDNLLEMNPLAYYQFIHYFFLLELDQDGYFEAFKFIQQLHEFHEQQCQKYDYISKSLILACYNRGKAYYEVSQFELSKYYFDIALKLISNITRSGSEMDSLRLLTLGYLSYLYFLTNDMESMKTTLQKAISIMQEAMSSMHSLETVVVWLNLFGFLLKQLYADLDDMFQQMELFELTIDNNTRVKIDLFFRKFVLGKMFYYAGDLNKAQELLLDAVQLQQYHIADDLRIKQTQNVSLHQLKEFQQQKIQMLKDYQEQQKKFKTTLPPPEKDNLTVRLLMEVYDWLGYIYIKKNQEQRALICYNLYEQYMYNLFRFEETLIDEYTMRWAKIQFYLKNYDESLRLFSKLSCDLRKQQVDEDLYFEYQQIQSELSRWMGTLYLLQNKDSAATVSFIRSKEELIKLYRINQVNEVSSKTQTTTRLHTNVSNPKLLSQQQDEDIPSVQQSQLRVQHQNEIMTTNIMVQLSIVKSSFREQKYLQLQQAPILILLIQNYIRIIWDCAALNLTKLSIKYIEEFLNFIAKDPYLNSPIFVNVIKASMRSDCFFLIGYLYGLRGQHEEAFIFFKRSFTIIKLLYDSNQMDQQSILRMSLIYDQMSRVLSNQGFYIYSKQYLMTSLQLMQQVKKRVDPIQIAYKHANLGNLLFRLGQYNDAKLHTENALQIFQEEYGKISVQVLQVRTKLLEILLQSSSKSIDAKKSTLELIETFKILSETQYSTRLDGQIERMIGSYNHKQGKYQEALNLYISAFVKLLNDPEQGMMILNSLSAENKNVKNLLNIKQSDKASLDVALTICQLYIDNLQFEEGFDLLIKLLEFSDGIPYDPPELGKIEIFGHDQDYEIHTNTDGVLKVIQCLHRFVNSKNTTTVYDQRRADLFEKIKCRRYINLLFIADIYRLLGHILNYWERQRIEPYYFQNYTQILAKYSSFASKFSSQKQNIQRMRGQFVDHYQNEIYFYLLDALIIYQEALGDYHYNFIETLYLLTERQYIIEQYEDVQKQSIQVMGLLKQQQIKFPLKSWRLMLLQAKTNLQNCKVYKQLTTIIHKYNLDPQTKDDQQSIKVGQLAIIKLLRSENEEFCFFLDHIDNKTEEQIVATLTMEINAAKVEQEFELTKNNKQEKKSTSQIGSQGKIGKKQQSQASVNERRILDKELLPQQQRILFEELDHLKNIKKSIERYQRIKAKKSKLGVHHKPEGNQAVNQFYIEQFQYEVKQIEELIINILGKSYDNNNQIDD